MSDPHTPFFSFSLRAGAPPLSQTLQTAGIYADPFLLEAADTTLYLFGDPILAQKINHQASAERLLSLDPRQIQTINGTFLALIHDHKRHILRLISDRFAALPCFYGWKDGALYAATQYAALLQLLPHKPVLLSTNLFEYITFQRLHGEHTFDATTKTLSAGTILKIDLTTGAHKFTRYWEPNFAKDGRATTRQFGAELAELTQAAWQARTSDGLQPGLLLSGGLDSRVVLAAAAHPPTCFTLGASQNNEFRVAAAAAQAVGAPHHFMPRPPDAGGQKLAAGVFLGHGMNTFDHAHFLDLQPLVSQGVEVVFHGHGFDYFFQGMYLPKKRRLLFGKYATFVDRLLPLPADLTQLTTQYSTQCKFRLKGIDPLTLVRPALRDRLTEGLHATLLTVARRVESQAAEPYDVWDYLLWHNLSRHYTNLNLQSMRATLPERTLTFDNQILDLFLRIPASKRQSGQVLRQALRQLSPQLAGLVNANTNLPAGLSPVEATRFWYRRRLLNRLGLSVKVPYPPPPEERSWPTRDASLRSDPLLRQRTEQLAASERLGDLGLFEMTTVKQLVADHLSERTNVGAALMTLLTLDQFLAEVA